MATDLPQSIVRPGALTALLGRLAEAPEEERESAWEAVLRPGARVGRFDLVREIGRGGFGVVWEAHDRELGRSVAFKALRGGAGRARPDALLVAEAEAAARLAHPNIVHLYDLGKAEAGPFLIMELLRGRTLASWLAEGPLQPLAAVQVAAEVARGLAHAHRQGVVHRDLKPGNAFVCDDDQVKVLDFGLALVLGRVGSSGGTPGYMAPEQVRGEAGDARSDVYALGCILFEALAGRLPFEPGAPGLAPGAALPEHPRVPPTLARLLARMLARDPGERPADGAAALEELERIRRALEPRRLARLAAFVAVGLALGTGAGWLLRDPPLPAGRLLVAMADTENATRDPDLDGVSVLLRTGLEQSKRLSLMDRSRLVGLLREAGRTVPGAIGEADALVAAERARAQLLLLPAVRANAAGFDLSVRAVDLVRQEPLFTIRESATVKGSIPETLDRLIGRVRDQLREDPATRKAAYQSLGKVVPVDPAAWRHYAEGRRHASEGRWEEALEAYQRAVAVDPDFPLPHLELAFLVQFDDERAVERHVDVAMRHLDRIPPRERGLAEAMEAAVRFDFTREVELFDRVIAEWPESAEAYRFAAMVEGVQFGDPSRARPYLEKLLVMGVLGPVDGVRALVQVGRLDEALERARRWVEQQPGPSSLIALSWVHRLRGEPAPALVAARRALAAGGQPGHRLIWSFFEADAVDEIQGWLDRARPGDPFLLALRGRRGDALKALKSQERPANAPRYEQAQYHLNRADLLQGDGDLRGVWREVQWLLVEGVSFASCYPSILAWLGDLDRAERLDSLWPMIDARTPCRRLYRAIHAWRTGDRDGALRLLASLHWADSTFHRGEILLDGGQWREAAEAFRQYRRDPAIFDGDWIATFGYPRSLYLEAVAHERLGERDEARQLLARLFHLWERADPGLPTLAEARALQARLGR